MDSHSLSEVTEVTFDPSIITYRSILDFFWSHHDPTLHNKKQYQSAILWTNEDEEKIAKETYEEQKVGQHIYSASAYF